MRQSAGLSPCNSGSSDQVAGTNVGVLNRNSPTGSRGSGDQLTGANAGIINRDSATGTTGSGNSGAADANAVLGRLRPEEDDLAGPVAESAVSPGRRGPVR